MPPAAADVARLAVNVLRGLAMDAVEKASSGHPGMPMGCADVAYVLWTQHLRFDPSCPGWPDRDRFVLSAGHGSMLLYAALHLSGYDVSLDDLRAFRQWGGKTPGHPENHLTPGVEMATGPLGQGLATAVGMAVAERYLRHSYQDAEGPLYDHWTYVLASDGDLMEGVSHEACSFAGHQGLDRLVVIYDDNDVTIDGAARLSCTDDWQRRFEALGWHVQAVDGHDHAAVSAAISEARAAEGRPSIVGCRTTIGFGSPSYAGTARTHGAALGADEVEAAKEALGLPAGQAFFVPEEAKAAWAARAGAGKAEREGWERRWREFQASRPEPARAFRMTADLGPPPAFPKPEATRASSARALERVAEAMPHWLSACADLAESVRTLLPGTVPMQRDCPTGRNLYFGIREHAMAAAANGIVLHGGMRASAGSFLVFSDYCRPSIRLAALMGVPTVFVFSHDSIGLGEDGPTHQPVEHLMSLRLIPNLDVWRPADGRETWAAWQSALSRTDGPTLIALSRQSVEQCSPEGADVGRGGYVVVDGGPAPRCCVVATGSELGIAVEAAARLPDCRVVSLPCWEAFDRQPAGYRDSVLPPGLPTVSVEAGATLGWQKYAQAHVGLDRFGASAPAQVLYAELGITADAVVAAAKKLLS